MAVDILNLGFKVDTASVKSASKDLDGLSKSAKTSGDSLGKMGKDAEQASKGTSTLSSSIKGLVGAYAGLAGISALGRTIDEYTKFTAQLKLATNSQSQFTQAYQNSIAIAKSSQGDLAAVSTLYARTSKSLDQLGASQAQIANITETVALSLKVSGATAQEASSAMLQLSQAFGSGKLAGDEFRAMMESAPALMQALATSLNVPIGSLKQMATDGELTSEKLANAFKNPALLASLKEQAKNVQTISGSYQVLKNELTISIGEFDKATGVSKVLAGAIRGIGENLEYVIPLVAALAVGIAGLYSASIIAGIASLTRGIGALAAIFAGPAGIVALAVGATAALVMFASKSSAALDDVKAKAKELNEELKKTQPNSQYEESFKKINEYDAERNALTEKRKTLLVEINNLEGAGSAFANMAEGKKKQLQETNVLIEAANVLLKEQYKTVNDIASAGDPLKAAKQTWSDLTKELKMVSVSKEEFANTSKLIEEAGAREGKSHKQVAEAVEALRVKLGLAKKAKIEDNTSAVELANTYADMTKKLLELSEPQKTQTDLLEEQLATIYKLDKGWKDWAQTKIDAIKDKAFEEQILAEGKAYDAMIESVEQAIQKQKDENDVARGLAKSIDEIIVKRLEEKKVILDSLGLATGELEKEIELRKQLNSEVGYSKALDAEKKQNEERIKVVKEAADDLKKVNDKIAEDFNKSLTDAIFRGFESGKSFARNFRDSLVNSFKTLILRPIVQFLVDSSGITKVLSGIAGAVTSGSAAAGVGGEAAGIGGEFGGLSTIYDAVTKGFDTANIAFEQSIQKFGTWVTSFGTEGSALTNLGGTISQYSATIAKALPYAGSVIKLLEGDFTGAAFTAAGTAIGSAIGGPIGGAIGSFLGSTVGSLFGGGTPTYGDYTRGNYVNGVYTTQTTSTEGEGSIGAVDALTALNKQFSETLGSFLKALGSSDTFQWIDSAFKQKGDKKSGNFSGIINGNYFGQSYHQVKDFDELVKNSLTVVMVEAIQKSSLSSAIKSLFDGLTDSTQISNMMNATINLTNASVGLDRQFGLTTEQAILVAKNFSGTTEELTKAINGFAQLGGESTTVADKILDFKTKLTEGFSELNSGNLPSSLSEFNTILKSIDKTTEAGIDSFSALFALRENFVIFTNALNELKAGVSGSTFQLSTPIEQATKLQQELVTIFESLNLTVPATAQALIELGNSIDYTTAEGLNLAMAFPDLVKAFQATQNAINAALTDARQAVSTAETNLKASFDAERARLQGIISAVDTAYQALESAVSAQRSILQQAIASAESNLSTARSNLENAFNTERNRLQGIIDKSKSAEDNLRNIFNTTADGLRGTIQAYKDSAKSIRDFRLSLANANVFGTSQVTNTKNIFDRVIAASKSGDVEALQNIQGATTDYLSAFQEYSTDFVAYAREFAKVNQSLADTEDVTLANADVSQLQLDALTEQVGSLIDLTVLATDLNGAINEVITAQLDAGLAQTELVRINKQQENLLGTLVEETLTISDALVQFNKAQGELLSAQSSLSEFEKTVADYLGKQNTENVSVADALKDYKDALALGNQATLDLATLNQKQIDTLGNVNGSLLSLTDALAAYTEAITSLNNLQTTSGAAGTASRTPSSIYTEFLGRPADTSGLAYWTEQFGAIVDMAELKTFQTAVKDTMAQIGVDAYRAMFGDSALAKTQDFMNMQFANGGAFTNGIVSRPTAFNTAVMGEAGSEAIMPLTNIGGKLGVSTNNSEMVTQLAIISEKMSRLEAAQIATAQNTGKVAKIVERADNGDSLNVTVLA